MNRSTAESVVGHLEDLRRRIIFVLVFFLVALIVSIAFVGNVYNFLIAPAHIRLAVLGPGDVVQIYLMIAGVAALAVTTPFLLWQLWVFVGPGLLPRERRYALQLIAPITIMFLAGMAFGFFVVFPNIFRFLKQLATARFDFIPTAPEYFSFMFNIVIPFGLLFELPVVVMFLTRIGLITPKWMRKVRRYAYFTCIVLGTLISPPELISHLSVTVPMILIYELSIGISVLAYRRKLASEAWWREDEAGGRRGGRRRRKGGRGRGPGGDPGGPSGVGGVGVDGGGPGGSGGDGRVNGDPTGDRAGGGNPGDAVSDDPSDDLGSLGGGLGSKTGAGSPSGGTGGTGGTERPIAMRVGLTQNLTADALTQPDGQGETRGPVGSGIVTRTPVNPTPTSNLGTGERRSKTAPPILPRRPGISVDERE